MTPAPEAARPANPERVDLAPLKGNARAGYPPTHPYRLALEALPDSVSRLDYLAHLRILVPLARIREER